MKKLLILAIILVLTSCSVPEQKTETIVIYKNAPPEKELGGKKPYIAANREFDGVRHEKLRKQIDYKYNEVHDALSKAYYEETEFSWKGTDYGVLDEETFIKLQAMIWARYEILFHEENLKQDEKDKIPESEYNNILDDDGLTVIDKKDDKALEKINNLKSEGIDIDL